MSEPTAHPIKCEKLPPPPSSPIFRLFGGLFLALGVAVIYFTSAELLPFFTQDSTGIIKSLWAQDLENLSQQHLLPDGWLHLKEVHFTSATEKADEPIEKELRKVEPFIPTHADGTYRLNVFFDLWNESDTHAKGALIQYSLVNITNGNTEWEIARTLPLNEEARTAQRKTQTQGAAPGKTAAATSPTSTTLAPKIEIKRVQKTQ